MRGAPFQLAKTPTWAPRAPPQNPKIKFKWGPESILKGIFTFEMVFCQKGTFHICKIKVYEGDGGPLERSKTTPRGPKIGKTTFGTQGAK